jgi:adenylate cyclase
MILEEIAALNLDHLNSGRRAVSISIGLQYGQVLVGPIASSRRFGPTIIGDTVNVASRLEQRAQALRAEMVVGDDLIQKARSEPGSDASELAQFVRLGPLAVNGREAPVSVWTHSTLIRSAASVPLAGSEASGGHRPRSPGPASVHQNSAGA